MGGRGAKSGVSKGAINNINSITTTKQQEIIEKYKRNISKRVYAVPESLTFSPGENGRIDFSFQEKKMTTYSHVGKMVDPLKDKMYERTTTISGWIGKDGLVVRNTPQNKDEYLGTRKQLLKQGYKIWDGT